jgi:hypothetical protein
MSTVIFLFQLVLVFVSISFTFTLDICGNYCGPDWCGARISQECSGYSKGYTCDKASTDCQERVPTDGSCADACCMQHDACCGSLNRRPCNNNVINCLKTCRHSNNTKHCLHGYLPVPVDAVLVAMELDPYNCCGTKCSGGNNTRSNVRTTTNTPTT